MSILARFEKQLASRGLSIEYKGEGNFSLCGPAAEKTPEIIKACKVLKPLLLEKYAAAANDPANTIKAEDLPFPGTPTYADEMNPRLTPPPAATTTGEDITRSPTPEGFEPGILPRPKPDEKFEDQQWTICSTCKGDVNITQLKALTMGIWKELCGEAECPYKPAGSTG